MWSSSGSSPLSGYVVLLSFVTFCWENIPRLKKHHGNRIWKGKHKIKQCNQMTKVETEAKHCWAVSEICLQARAASCEERILYSRLVSDAETFWDRKERCKNKFTCAIRRGESWVEDSSSHCARCETDRRGHILEKCFTLQVLRAQLTKGAADRKANHLSLNCELFSFTSSMSIGACFLAICAPGSTNHNRKESWKVKTFTESCRVQTSAHLSECTFSTRTCTRRIARQDLFHENMKKMFSWKKFTCQKGKPWFLAFNGNTMKNFLLTGKLESFSRSGKNPANAYSLPKDAEKHPHQLPPPQKKKTTHTHTKREDSFCELHLPFLSKRRSLSRKYLAIPEGGVCEGKVMPCRLAFSRLQEHFFFALDSARNFSFFSCWTSFAKCPPRFFDSPCFKFIAWFSSLFWASFLSARPLTTGIFLAGGFTLWALSKALSDRARW